MKPTKYCNCIKCSDCSDYMECVEYEIEGAISGGKLSFGELKNRLKKISNSGRDT